MRTAKVLLFDPDGFALVLYRSRTHPLYAHQPDLPGGIIERSESYEDGLAREILEETGITIDPALLVPAAQSARILLSDARMFSARLRERPDVTLSWEHERYAWIATGELARELNSRDRFMKLAKDALTHL